MEIGIDLVEIAQKLVDELEAERARIDMKLEGVVLLFNALKSQIDGASKAQTGKAPKPESGGKVQAKVQVAKINENGGGDYGP